MIVAVTSGRGGSGRTTVSVNLARSFDGDVFLADCNVEKPCVRDFFAASVVDRKVVSVPIPRVVENLCVGCDECLRVCHFSAITKLGKVPLIVSELCCGCGGCSLICPTKAIVEEEKRIGIVEVAVSGRITIVSGILDTGVFLPLPLIKAIKSLIPRNLPVIIDAPLGITCSGYAAIKDTGFVLIVTDPTPCGIRYLDSTVRTVKKLGIPFGVIVNYGGIGDNGVYSFCSEGNIPIFLEIPDDRCIAECYCHGNILVDEVTVYRVLFEELRDRVIARRGRHTL